MSSKPAEDRGKRNVTKRAEVEKSYKFKENILVEKVALEIAGEEVIA